MPRCGTTGAGPADAARRGWCPGRRCARSGYSPYPLILDILGRTGFLRGLFEWFPGSPVTRAIVLIVTVLTLSLLLVDVLLRTPVSRHLVARPGFRCRERRLREARARRRTRVTPDH